MDTRIIGIDLAVTAKHKAIVLDQASNRYVSSLLTFHTTPAELDRVFNIAREGASEDVRVVVVLEATGMSWFTVGSYLERKGAEVYRVSGQKTAAQRRVYNRFAKADRIDARVLARLFLTVPDRLHRLWLPSGLHLALQKACREHDQLRHQIAAIKTRLLSIDNFAWLNLNDIVDPYSKAAFWIRSQWYNPWRVLAAGQEQLISAWLAAYPTEVDTDWIPKLITKAQMGVDFYHDPSVVDYEFLQSQLDRQQNRLLLLRQQDHDLRISTLRPLYRRLHPSRHLESIPGIGQDSAAVYIAFIGDILRFPTIKQFRGWSGMIPFSDQSGQAQAKGLHITQAGSDLIKSTAFLNAQVARLHDPQIAAIYYEQMMFKGNHFLQAICACSTHLLNRIYSILRQDRPYQLRDVDDTPITKQRARQICSQRYFIPDKIRRRRNFRSRRQTSEDKVEQRYLHSLS